MSINFTEPWFTAIRVGRKTVEGRLNKGKTAAMNADNATETYRIRIVAIRDHSSFENMLRAEGLSKTIPPTQDLCPHVEIDCTTLDSCVTLYMKPAEEGGYFTKKDLETYTGRALEIATIDEPALPE